MTIADEVVNEQSPSVGKVRHELAIMDRTGDTKIMWDLSNADDIANAKKQFEELTKQGYSIFKVNRVGGKGERVSTFDPRDEKLIAVPRITAG